MNANNTNNNRKENRDNLQEIKGIGPDYERDLDQLGVLTFAHLAEFESAAQIQYALEKSGSEIPLWKIEKFDWIGQAKKKVEHQKTLPVVEQAVVSKRDQNRAKSIKPWKEHAAFIVSFDHHTDKEGEESWRTRVYKTENGDEVEFGGMDPSAWTKWIFEQAKLTIIKAYVDEVVEAEESDSPENELVVTHVPATETFKQFNLVDVQVIRPSTSIPQRELMVQVHFELLGSEVEIWTEERSSYRLELYLLDLERKVTEPVASTQKRFEPGILEYEVGEVIPIPSPGRYELFVLLFSLPPTAIMATHQGPIINVVPHPVSFQ